MAFCGQMICCSKLADCCWICWIDLSGVATTLRSKPEIVFRPVVITAQQGSTNWLIALLGTRKIAVTSMAANTNLLFSMFQIRVMVCRFILSPCPLRLLRPAQYVIHLVPPISCRLRAGLSHGVVV